MPPHHGAGLHDDQGGAVRHSRPPRGKEDPKGTPTYSPRSVSAVGRNINARNENGLFSRHKFVTRRDRRARR
jgi:hypothetical protein